MQKKTAENPDQLAYHRDMINVPLDASIVPTITELLFKLINAERNVLIKAVEGLKVEVNHYKTLLLTEEEVEVKPKPNSWGEDQF